MADSVVQVKVRSASCPGCGAPIRITAQGITLTYSCPSCLALIDVQKIDALRILSQAHRAANAFPLAIPLGTRGMLKGRQWQVIGFMVRMDGTEQYFWREYLLFNPAHGFRWLMEMDGHWNYVERVRERPVGGAALVSLRGVDYKIFLRGEAKVAHVVGEFYWRVERGETVRVQDFIAPPQGLSSEISDQEEVWSHLTYIPAAEIEAAFKGAQLPAQTGVAPLQPFQGAPGGAGGKAAWVFVGVILAMRFGLLPGVVHRGEVLADLKGAILVGSPGEYQVSEPFQVRHLSPVEFIFSQRGLSNASIAFDVTLFNEATGEKRDVDGSVGFYEGSDSDGYWSEGGTTSTQTLNRVEPGEYRMVVAAQAKQDGSVYGSRSISDHRVSFGVNARTQPGDYGFTLMALLAVILPVAGRHRSRGSFEQRRWENSGLDGDGGSASKDDNEDDDE